MENNAVKTNQRKVIRGLYANSETHNDSLFLTALFVDKSYPKTFIYSSIY